MSSLYIVSTPIGNLKDITFRALETLSSVEHILCEDTRKTRHLLDHFQIQKPLLSLHQHSSPAKARHIISLLKDEKDLALVTDSGTPGICDPGNLLIHTLLTADIPNFKIIPIPGPCALTTLASVSGFNTDKFIFLGFLPRKKGKQKVLKDISAETFPVIFYEAPSRIVKTLEQLQEFIEPTRKVIVGRELTKAHETFYRGILSTVLQGIKADPVKGEYVICIAQKHRHSLIPTL